MITEKDKYEKKKNLREREKEIYITAAKGQKKVM